MSTTFSTQIIAAPVTGASFTTLQQALHIFKKDVLSFRIEIAGVFALFTLLILTSVQSWESLQESGGSHASDGDNPFTVLLPLVWCLLIARVIQAEALPGDRHFWLTRPYSRAGLVLSKLLFVAAIINLPLLVAQAMIVTFSGLPLFSNLGGLLWNQVLVSGLILLPSAAIASLTRNLAQFLPAAVLGAGALAIGMASDERFRLADLEWVRWTVGLCVAIGITTAVLWRQYRLRRTIRTALMTAAACVAGLVLYLAFPQRAAFAIQTQLLPGANGSLAMRIGDAPDVKDTKATAKTENKYWQAVQLPLVVTGANAAELRIESSTVSFKTLSGATRRANQNRVTVGPTGLSHATGVDREFFEAAKNSPVTVRAEYYLTRFSEARSVNVPLDGTPVYIPDVGQCGTAQNYDHRTFLCRSAFRQPQEFGSDRLGGHSWRRWGAYTPFPAHLTINPLVAQQYQLKGDDKRSLAPTAPEPPVALTIRKRIGYVRHTMEIPNVHLGDYAAAAVDGNDEP